MKKAQLYGHIFIYILTITVTSFTVIRLQCDKNFQDKTDQEASCIKFRNDLKSAVYTIMSDYGTIKRKILNFAQITTKFALWKHTDR